MSRVLLAFAFLAGAFQSSNDYGDPKTWPGDTTGLSTYASLNQVVLSWGSAVNSHKSEIYSSVVKFS